MYYSQDVAKLQEVFPSAVRDLQPLRSLATADTGLQVNLWLGSEKLQTFMHYDASYNFFAQLRGRKRFTLFPPNASMYPWPCLHPHIGHAQVDWRPDADADDLRQRFPSFSPEGVVTAEVGRGDVRLKSRWVHQHVATRIVYHHHNHASPAATVFFVTATTTAAAAAAAAATTTTTNAADDDAI
jgi:hypothetical protein